MRPTIPNIGDPSKALKWTVFHVILGACTTLTPWVFIVYFYLVLVFNLKAGLNGIRRGDITYFLLTFTYILSFELIARMTKSYPFVPSEYTKYLMIFLGLYALFISPRKANKVGVALIVLLIPSIFFDFSDSRQWYDVVNNWFGAMALAVCTALLGSYSVNDLLVRRILRLMWLPMVAMLVNMLIKSPELDDMSFGLKATQLTTGGAASNQASTMLGFGMFLSFYSYYSREKFSSHRLIDVVFMLLFSYQGLITFSRGGMITGAIAIVMLLFSSGSIQANRGMSNGAGNAGRLKSLAFFLIGGLLMAQMYFFIDQATGGKLSLRYQGETAGTVGGYANKDLGKITNGRSSIMEEDFAIFLKYPLLGSGAGSSNHLRDLTYLVAPHIELSRLMAEQGLLGLIFFVLLMQIGWKTWRARNNINTGHLLFILFTVGILTSFHAAIRTMITPFLIAVCSMTLGLNQKPSATARKTGKRASFERGQGSTSIMRREFNGRVTF